MRKREIGDYLFGNLIWDNELDWWTGNAEINSGQLVDIAIEMADDNYNQISESVRTNFIQIREQETYFRLASASVLLDVYNNIWKEGECIDGEAFIKRIHLESIVFHCDGRISLYYNDGDLFGGHSILVSLSDRGNFIDAVIAG